VKSNPTRESNAKTPPLYPFQLNPNALKPESYAILRLILVRSFWVVIGGGVVGGVEVGIRRVERIVIGLRG
jgi:hypothetical protein